MKEYYFKNGEFVIENYDKQRVFTSFLPAIAGKMGIPLWTFYVNRGQCMSSFGVRDKNGAILEFFPAYTAYQVVNRIGFRTFVKVNKKVYEFFADNKTKSIRRMFIKREQFSIEEENRTLNLKVKVTYYTLPNAEIAALIRKVEIENLDATEKDIELIDGLSQIFTPGVDHGSFKVMSNLLRSWMDVNGLDQNIAFYKLRASTSDSAEVKEVQEGNFYLSSIDGKLIKPIVDPTILFGYDNSYSRAIKFEENDLETLLHMPSYCANKVPCGFSACALHLGGHERKQLFTVIGQSYSYDDLLKMKNRLSDENYLLAKQIENTTLIDDMTKDVKTHTADLLFNEYIESTYLDNMLRGGYPFNFVDSNHQSHIYYLFSRKHGDPERDYNWFTILNEYYSQGNGNFRDICQNRRNDSMIHAEVKDYNLKYFMNLVQLDGYNPLSVNGATFSLKKEASLDSILERNFASHQDEMKKVLLNSFTPGKIVNTAVQKHVQMKVSYEDCLKDILHESNENIEATFGEGYWLDHFSYLLDLYESYVAIYPDCIEKTMFEDYSYRFFESPCLVQPRSAKYVKTPNGTIRQYGALYEHDDVKCNYFQLNPSITNWAKDKHMNLISTNLYSKFFMLGFLKFNLLDCEGIGIEMEAGKPGWNDACNGLPGLFGSGVSETFETLRIILMLLDVGKKNNDQTMLLPYEFWQFFKENMRLLDTYLDDFSYWDKASTLRENYREKLRKGISRMVKVNVKDQLRSLKKMEKKLKSAILKAKEIGGGIYPTFITYEATDYEYILDSHRHQKCGYQGYPLVKVHAFKRNEIAKFLEAPARSYKVIHDKKELKVQYHQVKESDIYDRELKMYKTSESLDHESFEIGRIKAFTKGWLERESNFMHMTYKYLYGLLKANLYKEFFEEIKTNMVCNMNPKTYGRSPLEHSSFIASSCNPDKNVHGQGFVSRLSGSTAEMLSIYLLMMTGGKPFVVENGHLKFVLKPILTKNYFDLENKVCFTFLSKTKITYINPLKKDTYRGRCASYTLIRGNNKETLREVIDEKAVLIRDGYYDEIVVEID